MDFQYSEENVQRLRDKYKDEVKSDLLQKATTEENPIRTCMRIMFEAASEKDASRRGDLALELSKILTRPDGLINLFLAVIDFDPSSQIQTTHNQRFMAVANIIAFLPKLCLPYVKYCSNLISQLTPLVTHQHSGYSSLSCLIVKALIDSPHAVKSQLEVQEALLSPFIDPLKKRDATLRPHDAILGIHHLILNRLPTRLFVDLFPSLFYCLVELHNSPSQLKGYLKTIIVKILKDLKPGPACCLIGQTLFHSSSLPSYKLKADDEHITLDLVEESELMPCFETSKHVMIELLEQCDDKLLILEFFFHFQAKMWTSTDSSVNQKCASLIEPLLEQAVQENPSNKFDLLTSVISNRHHALDLISRVLINYLECARMDRHRNKKIHPSLANCLDILEVLSSTLDSYDNQILNTLIQIRSIFGPEEVQNLDSLILKMSNKPERETSSAGLTSIGYDEAIGDLNDCLVPVRVHALVKLKNLIISGDQYTASRIPNLFTMIESSLADQESYVFLASIELMSEMAFRKTTELLPRLLSLYTKEELGVQHRINVGEVVVRLTRKMNEMTPAYAQQMIGTFLDAATQSDQELVRMSSLTNIGEICKNLGDSLGKYLVEIMTCVKHILETDTLPTRCASIELLRLSLMGVDARTVESSQRELSSLYKLLKDLRKSTIDDTLSLQVDLALDEIDRVARQVLGRDPPEVGCQLVKNIKVISLLN